MNEHIIPNEINPVRSQIPNASADALARRTSNGIKEQLNGVKFYALLAEENLKEEVFLLRRAFELGLKNSEISVISLPKNKESEFLSSYEEKWRPFLEDIDEPKTEKQSKTIIKIPKKEFVVKELSYNEEEDFFALVITSQNGPLKKEITIFEETLPEPDAVLCFFKDRQKMENFKSAIKFPEEKNILIFDDLNENLAAETSLPPPRKIYTEKMINLFQILSFDFSPSVLNLLFGALVVETNNFKDYSNKEIFSLANFLLGRGADAKTLKNILENGKTNDFIRLTGRAAARSHYEEQNEVSWSFLAKKDFEKTNHSPSLEVILRVIKEAEKLIKSAKIFVLCWQAQLENSSLTGQKEEAVFGLIKSGEKFLLSDLAEKLNLQLQSDYLLAGPFQNFSEAEIKIKEAMADF